MNAISAMTTRNELISFPKNQMQLIRHTVAADCNEDEFNLFMAAAQMAGLNPIQKQIYAVVYNKNDASKRKMSIIIGIDGFRAIAARNGDYRPDESEPKFYYDNDLKDPNSNPKGIERVVVTVHKQDGAGAWHPLQAVAYWDEYVPLKPKFEKDGSGKFRPTGEYWPLDRSSNWYRMGRVMLAKCAEAQALRRGWPEDLSGIYEGAEMDQAAAIDLTPSEMVEAADVDDRLARINGPSGIAFSFDPFSPLEIIPIGQVADRLMAWIKSTDDVTSLSSFASRNEAGLKEFWARAKDDALAVREAREAKIERLKEAK